MKKDAQLQTEIESLQGQVSALRTLVQMLFMHSPAATQMLQTLDLQGCEDLSMGRALPDELIRAQQDLLALVKSEAG